MLTALIPLPLFHNADKSGRREPVGDEEFIATGEEVSNRFGGAALHIFRKGGVEGFWFDRGVVHRDVLAFLEIDIEDTAAAREAVRAYAHNVLKRRFRQDAIYIKFVGPIESLTVADEQV